MSIKLENITKLYGDQKAVDGISFSVKKAEIVGFLGPNGAGKTTTMKIISTFLQANSGKATVCGYDVNDSPDEVRKRLGYLPEHNPLYLDMYVKEYLAFIAGLHNLKKRKDKIEELLVKVGLQKEAHKKIGSLSKGYRQRVGLAQAIIHDPEVLILDEPTTGLDPNQLLEIRKLIVGFGKEKTVLFSSHIMQEVQAICDRVIIINDGKIVADDPIDVLTHYQDEEMIVEVKFADPIEPKLIEKIDGLKSVDPISADSFKLIIEKEKGKMVKRSIFNLAQEKETYLLHLNEKGLNVEDVFQKLTN